MNKLLLLAAGVIFLMSNTAIAQVYSYVDANGQRIYTDQPPASSKVKR